jgi:hypothetical protein
MEHNSDLSQLHPRIPSLGGLTLSYSDEKKRRDKEEKKRQRGVAINIGKKERRNTL